MQPPSDPESQFLNIAARAQELEALIEEFSAAERLKVKSALKPRAATESLNRIKKLIEISSTLVREMSPASAARIQVTLGRSESIAKFFAFNFIAQPKRKFTKLNAEAFLGSGAYAIYYHGSSEAAYQPISKTETPIYIGKADPRHPYADTVEAQGPAIHMRLGEHAKSIVKGGLDLEEFRYRAATIQSGMQAAVEEFLIRLFRPIWNKEVKIAFGIGKHGDSAETRKNKRSPWDTMHPGRKWAALTTEDQLSRESIVEKIQAHFALHPPYKTLSELFTALLTA